MEWIDRLFRLIGSANILTSTENCNWHKDFTHTFTFGARTPPANWLDAKLGILWGHNPAKTWLAQASLISRARSRGMKLVVIDPRRSTSALDADLWLRVKPGADAALALCAVRELIETGRYDKEFIGCWSNAPFLIDDRTGCFLRPSAGSAQFVVWNSRHGRPEATSTECADPNWTDWSLRYRGTVETPSGPVQASTALNHLWTAAAPWDYGTTSTHTGIPISELRKFIDLLTEAMPAIGYHAWTGIAQHANATQTERAIACLYALLGGFDRRGGNVQLPVLPARSTAVSTPLKNIATGAGGQRHPLGGSQIGYITGADFQDAVLDENPYPIRALLSFGANPILTQPDSKRTAKALSKLEFYVHVDLFHNPSNEYADVLLPSSSLYENDSVRLGWELTVEGAERLQYRPQLVSRRGDTRSDAEIAFLLARALGYHDDEYFALDLDAARDRVLEPLGITLAELKEKLVAKIPLQLREVPHARIQHTITAGRAVLRASPRGRTRRRPTLRSRARCRQWSALPALLREERILLSQPASCYQLAAQAGTTPECVCLRTCRRPASVESGYGCRDPHQRRSRHHDGRGGSVAGGRRADRGVRLVGGQP